MVDRVDLVIDVVHLEPRLEALVDVLDTNGKQASRGHQAVAIRGAIRWQQVACDLLLEEAIVWDVLVERVDDIVAIAPRVRVRDVARGPR